MFQNDLVATMITIINSGIDNSTKSKPSILSRSGSDPKEKTGVGGNVAPDRSRMTQMLGSAELSLPEHTTLLSECLSSRFSRTPPVISEIQLRLRDGVQVVDALVLAGVSPFLKQLLQESLDIQPGDWVRDEFPVLHLPDVTVHEMEILLRLLYTGNTRVYQRELSSLVTLTHLLKLISIPVAIVDDPPPPKKRGKVKEAHQRHERATITFIPEKVNIRGRPAKFLTTSIPKVTSFPADFLASPNTNTLKEKSSISTITLPTVSSNLARVVTDDVDIKKSISSTIVSETESDLEELVEEMHVFVSDEGHVERLELLNDGNSDKNPLKDVTKDTDNRKSYESYKLMEKTKESVKGSKVSSNTAGAVTVVQTEEGEGLDNLISVAEAFERSQQPDFNDIASPVVDGTDTEKHLVRNCVICSKSLLGRNALGRHMKNVHPKVFGPYKCSYPGCTKMIESGAKMVSHMYHHTGGRTKQQENNFKFPAEAEEDCDAELSPSGDKTETPKKTETAEGGKKQTFVCNAGDQNCTLSFTTAKNFIKHMKDIHKMKPWYCESCDKRFMERQNLQFHVMSHGDKKNFACDICNKSFANPRQLYTHRALHLGKRYLCQECGYRARSAANLRGHVKARHEAKKQACQVCGKKFSSGNNLKNHMRVHTGESPYACELCFVRFKRVHHLHSHIESKMHIDMMDKYRRKGNQVPQHLDPLRRVRGRAVVEDGPVTLANATHPQLETHITEVSDEGWPLHQVVVVEESVSIPVDQAQIEIIQEESDANNENSYILSV